MALTRRFSPKVPASLHPLTDKNFGVFWSGAFLSSIGFWIQNVGQGWQVLQLTNSAFLLGLVAFAATVPNLVLSLLGGAVSDRMNRRYLLMATQAFYMSTALILGIFTTLHIIAVWQIVLMAFLNGIVSSVGQPAWQTFVTDLVPPDELRQGIALNSMQFNLSRVIGPAIGGISVGLLGIAGSYYLNSLSYVAVIIPLALMHPKIRQSVATAQQSIIEGVREGLDYARRSPALRLALLLQFMIAFLIYPYATLLPIFAGDIFHIGATGLGVLNAAAGIGAFGGSVLLVALSQRLENGPRALMMLCAIGGMACVAFSLAHVINMALSLLVIVGACAVMSSTITNTTVQTTVPPEMRGRVLSLWVLALFGLAPFGNLAAGWVAQSIGAPLTLAISGTACAIVALLIAALRLRIQLKPKFAH